MQKKLRKIVISFTVLLLMSGVAFASSYIVPDGATQLAEPGTSADPAEWSLDGNFVTNAGFTIGGSDRHYNYLTIDATYSFTAVSNK